LINKEDKPPLLILLKHIEEGDPNPNYITKVKIQKIINILKEKYTLYQIGFEKEKYDGTTLLKSNDKRDLICIIKCF